MIFNKDIFLSNIRYLINRDCGGVAATFNDKIEQRDAVTRWKKPDTIPNTTALFAICEKFNCSFDWLFAEHNYDDENAESDATINIKEKQNRHNDDTPDFLCDCKQETIEACKDVKEIMESGNKVIVPALLSNLAAFKHGIRQDKRIDQLDSEISHLKQLHEGSQAGAS